MTYFTKYLVLLAVLLACLPCFSQNSGTLPNGTSWYLFADASRKGRADFALVQKNWKDVPMARKALSSLENFNEGEPYKFLAAKGVGYGKKGMISYMGNSTVYEFASVPTFDEAAADSTLLVLFDIMRGCPASQSIIICGDIKTSQLADRIQTLSLTVPRKKAFEAAPNLPAADKPSFSFRQTRNSEATTINIEYSAPRISADKFSTPLPLVTAKLSKTLSAILEDRFKKAFAKAGIPAVNISCKYTGSLSTAFDEIHSFSATVSSKDCRKALELMASELASLDKYGSDLGEFLQTDSKWISDLRSPMQKCIWNYLYGIPMKAASEESLEKKLLPAETRKALFDNFSSAILDADKALSIKISGPCEPDFDAIHSFKKKWENPDSSAFVSHYNDTVRFVGTKTRLKIKNSSSDKVSGGQLWTLSNGTKVVFKKTAELGDRCAFSLILKGGYSPIPSIKAGQSAFIGDLFSLRKVAGLSAADFRSTLESHHIELNAESDITGLNIKGSAPAYKLPLVLRILLSCAKDAEPDNKAYLWYVMEEYLREDMRSYSEQGLWDFLYSRLHPSYKFSEIKDCDVLDAGFQQAAENYFTTRFAHFNEAVLIIEGNFDESALQKTVCRNMGDFPVSTTSNVRQKAADEIKDVWYSTTRSAASAPVGDGRRCLAMSIAADHPIGMSSTIDFYLACQVIKEALIKEMAPYGLRAEIHPDYEIYPKERLSVNILCLPCPEEGLPEGVDPAGTVKAMEVMRSAIAGMSCSEKSDVWFNGVKNELISELAAEFGSAEGIIRYSGKRYLLGKDLVSDYQTAVKNSSREAVDGILRKLASGSRVEYTLR